MSRAMRAVKSADTSPERILRKGLSARGLRYRLHSRRLPGCPDIVFVSAKVAVFVDGDYWHGNQWKLRGHKSLKSQFSNIRHRAYWEKKIERNMARDRKVSAALRKEGWKVIRVWESDIKTRPAWAVDRIQRAVARRRKSTGAP